MNQLAVSASVMCGQQRHSGCKAGTNLERVARPVGEGWRLEGVGWRGLCGNLDPARRLQRFHVDIFKGNSGFTAQLKCVSPSRSQVGDLRCNSCCPAQG
jgi:hypothetical protein